MPVVNIDDTGDRVSKHTDLMLIIYVIPSVLDSGIVNRELDLPHSVCKVKRNQLALVARRKVDPKYRHCTVMK